MLANLKPTITYITGMFGPGFLRTRIAVVSDIHGNRCAFDAVLKDLKEAAPDVVVASVLRNTDEMLWIAERLTHLNLYPPGRSSSTGPDGLMKAAAFEEYF